MDSTQFINPLFAPFHTLRYITVQICPTCKKCVIDLLEVDFLQDTGECAQCDHNRYSIYDYMEEFQYAEEN